MLRSRGATFSKKQTWGGIVEDNSPPRDKTSGEGPGWQKRGRDVTMEIAVGRQEKGRRVVELVAGQDERPNDRERLRSVDRRATRVNAQGQRRWPK